MSLFLVSLHPTGRIHDVAWVSQTAGNVLDSVYRKQLHLVPKNGLRLSLHVLADASPGAFLCLYRHVFHCPELMT